MRKVLFAATMVLLTCAVVVAADKLSARAKQKVALIEAKLRERLREKPLDFHQLCRFELVRHDVKEEEFEDGEEYLESLFTLREGLLKGIRRLNPYWRPKEPTLPEEREYEYIQKEFDVSDIISQAPDRPAPLIGFGRGPFLKGSTTRGAGKPKDGAGAIAFGDEESVGVGFDWEKLQELIERVLPEDGYDREIRSMGGRLICRVTKEQAGVIEDLLSQMRENAGYSVSMDVKFLRTTAEYLRKLRNDGEGPAIYLSAEAERQLMSDAASKQGVEILASSVVIAANRQVVHIREGQQVSMLMDYDLTSAGAPSLQPVVKLINEGLICQLRPVVVRKGGEVSIDVLASLSKVRKDTRKGDFLGGELMFPVMDVSLIRTAVRVPDGTSVIVGGATENVAGGKDAREFVVYVKPRAEHRKK